MKKLILGLLIALIHSTITQAEIRTQTVDYKAGDTVLKGFLAYDDSIKTKRPGVLVVHEWWGHNKYARKRARMLAKLGYTAFALDMYGDGKQASHPEDAGKFSTEVRQNRDMAKARFQAAMSVLQQHSTTSAEQIAAIGYCFGGAVVLEMARAGLDLDGVVSFHGTLDTANPAQPGKIKAKLLIANGEADPFISPESIEQFKKEMDNAGADYQFNSYPEAKHSFTNPDADLFGEKFNLPLQYNKNADQQSWSDMKAFLKDIFTEPD